VALHPFRPQSGDFTGLSLCAGYAGLDLGLHIAEPNYRTVCYVEREAHAAATLVARMDDAALAPALIWDDLKSFDGNPWRGRIHILTAGYPCQPFSFSGKRKGRDDPRHLWPDVARIAYEVQPEWIFVENVEGHLNLGCAEVIRSLRSLGYDAKAGLFSAREAGASHRRGRVFILAHTNRTRQRSLCRLDGLERIGAAGQNAQPQRSQHRTNSAEQRSTAMDATNDDLARGGMARIDDVIPLFAPGPGDLLAWESIIDLRPDLQPAILRTCDGMADRMDRTRGAGNGVFSMAAAVAWATLKSAFFSDAGGLL
jgi:DNA (cytosine-5)-methyltransferase 1